MWEEGFRGLAGDRQETLLLGYIGNERYQSRYWHNKSYLPRIDTLCVCYLGFCNHWSPVLNCVTHLGRSEILKLFAIRKGIGECYKACGLIVTLFPTMPEDELRIPKSLRHDDGLISRFDENIPLPLHSLLTFPSFPLATTTHTRPYQNHQPHLLHHGLPRQRPPAAPMLDRLRLPQTRHGRRRIPQIHQRSARPPRKRLNGEIRHGPLVNGTTLPTSHDPKSHPSPPSPLQ